MRVAMIIAVMTIYNPNLEVLRKNYNILKESSILLKVYDNTEGALQLQNKDFINKNLSSAEYVTEQSNLGLGRAFNVCIFDDINGDHKIKINEEDSILFLDQDTILDADSVMNFLLRYKRISSDERLGIYGGYPTRIDGTSYKVKKSYDKTPWADLIPALLVITSYSIIPVRVLKKVGKFREDFFIDHIDYDYCWKCRKNGLLTVVDPNCTFVHSVGMGDVKIFGKIICPISSTNRSYYQVRNSILSYKGFGITKTKLIREITKRFIVVFLTGLAARDLLSRTKFAIRGLIDGVYDKCGKI